MIIWLKLKETSQLTLLHKKEEVPKNFSYFSPFRGIFLLLDDFVCLWSLFLFLTCIWNDLPTKDGWSFNPKLLATCPRWSFLTIKILFNSPLWAVYARIQEQNASLASLFSLDWSMKIKKKKKIEKNDGINTCRMEQL